jgi:VWFA-related protein
MLLSRIKLLLAASAVIIFCAFFGIAQTTKDDDTERVLTEEIKLNFSAFDESGKFASGIAKEDLVISENGRLNQATSLRRIPANVLIVLDVGNEIAYAKRSKMTSETAKSLVNNLQSEDSVAVMQYADKVEFLAEWTQDKVFLNKILDEKNLGFGKRSVFNQAMDAAVKFFRKTPTENRHLILITDGIDTFNDQKLKDQWMKNLLSSDINVHVVSYTILQQNAIEVPKTVKGGGTQNRNTLPPGAGIPVQGQTPTYPILTINLDREMIRKRKEQIEQLKTSQQLLATIAEDTNGEIFLPESKDEMVEKTATLAKNIDSQYVATYTPKNPLSDAADGEIRNIIITSRREDVQIMGRRKFVVTNLK